MVIGTSRPWPTETLELLPPPWATVIVPRPCGNVTVTENCWLILCAGTELSITPIVKVKVPTPVGVPQTPALGDVPQAAPVASNVSHEGRPDGVQLYAGVPPVTPILAL